MKNILNERYSKCFFTGHRILSKGENAEKIKMILKSEIKSLINEYGVDTFICGGAIGFDTLAAQLVLEIKNENPDIRLEIYIPCHNHHIKWNYYSKFHWRIISSKADRKIYITDGPYETGCMHRRNRAMANDAYYCLAYCTKESSGTGKTLEYAREQGCDIRNIAEYI